MNHAFRLGPVSPGPPPSYAYAVALPSGKLEVRYAPTDSQGIMALREAAKGHPLTCDPELAEEAGLQLLEVAPLPPGLVESKAQLAYEVAAGIDRAASRPDATAAFLRAAGRFWSAKPWELIAPDEQLHVAFSVGRSRLQGELSLQAADPSQPRLVLCDEAAALDRLHGLAGEARVAALVKGAGLVVELVKEPAWAGAAIEAFFKLPRIPLPERRRAGRVAPTATQDLVLAAALLEAVVAFADLGDGTEAEAVVEAASLRVQARLGPSPLDPLALRVAEEEGLTRVRPEGEPQAPAPPPAAPAPAKAAEAGPEGEEDAPLSPAELAALLKGGLPAEPGDAAGPDRDREPDRDPDPDPDPDREPEARPAVEPSPAAEASPAAEEDAPLSPEELAALLKGGAAPSPPPPAPAPGPVPVPVPVPAPDEDDEAPMSPAELAALLKGGAAAATTEPAAPPPTPPAAIPAPPAPTPVAPPTAPPPASVAVPPAAASPAAAPAAVPAPPPGEGWLARTWKALGASLKRDHPPAQEPPKGAPPPKPKAPPPRPSAPKAAPAARRAAPPPPAAPPDPAVPFSAIAQALRIPVPVEPPPVTLAEREAEEALARQLVAAAAGRERFVSFPAVALQIIEQVHAPDADARGVAGFISRDPGLAADVLAVANSAAFRGVSEVGSVRDAVARLGLQEVGRVASAVSARALLVRAQPGGGPPSTALFTRAVAVATAASATALRLRGAHSDQVWLAGLLHDVGLALGASARAGLGAEAGEGPRAERALERAHAEIGASAMKAWGLPQYLADVCALHHDEAPPAGPDQVDLHLVRLTSALARLAEPAVAARAAAEILQSARALGLDVHAVRALAADLKAAEQRAAVLVR